MNFLGMGPLELMLIVVLALIVFGPEKLPEIMGQIGRAVGDFRRATSELSDEFNRTIKAELNETRQTIEETKSALTEVRSAVDSTVSETRAAVTGTAAPQRVAAPTPPALESPVPNGSGRDDNVNGAAVEPVPPLADTSQWSWETSPSPTTPEPGAAEAPGPVEPSAESSASTAASTSEPESRPDDGADTTSARQQRQRDELQPPY